MEKPKAKPKPKLGAKVKKVAGKVAARQQKSKHSSMTKPQTVAKAKEIIAKRKGDLPGGYTVKGTKTGKKADKNQSGSKKPETPAKPKSGLVRRELKQVQARHSAKGVTISDEKALRNARRNVRSRS